MSEAAPEIVERQGPRELSDATSELGVSGLLQSGGVVREEWLRELSGRRAARTYTEMGDTPAVGTSLITLRLLMRMAAWEIESTDETPQAEDAAAWLDTIPDDMSMSWDDVLDEALSMLQYGFAPLEIVLKRRAGREADPPSQFDDGTLGVRKLALRAQESIERWVFDEAGGLQGLMQRAGGKSVTIPIAKLLLFRTTHHKGSPEGRSLLRSAYEPYYYLRNIRRFEAIGIERDLAGIPSIGVPANLFNDLKNAAKLAAWKKVAANIRNDEQVGVLYPKEYAVDSEGRPVPGAPLYTVELLASPGGKQIDTEPVIARYVKEIVLALFADVRLLGMEKIGTQALAREKTDLLNQFLNSMLDEIESVLNRHLVPRLWAINGFDQRLMPAFRHERLKRVDVAELAKAILDLSQAGLMLAGDDELERHVRAELGLPPPPAEDGGVQVEQSAPERRSWWDRLRG